MSDLLERTTDGRAGSRSADTDRAPSVGDPIRLGRHELRNRIIGAPMERNLCLPDGSVTPAYVEYLTARARGGTALLFTEASYVRGDGKARPLQMGVHEDHIVGPLTQLAAAVHAEGALLGVELNHGGRTAQGRISGYRCVAPSAVACEVAGGEVPEPLSPEDIEDIIRCFGEAAARCVRAGVEVISLHGAHGYLITQFLSPRTNLRDDEWGEPGRFLAEVIRSVRAAAPSVTLGLRLSAHEGVPDGLDAERMFALIAEAPLDLLDFLDISAGSYEAGQWIVQPGEWQAGILGDYAQRYRSLGLPVSVAGRISDRATAERLLAEGKADMITVARAQHADPNFARAAITGSRTRPCIACSLCSDQHMTGVPVPCSVNPDLGRELSRPVSPEPRGSDGRRAVVIGSGPAGLEAAWRLAMVGVEVSLLERTASLGGQLRWAAGLREYPQYHRILDWYEHELSDLGVVIQRSMTADVATVNALQPDLLVLATGADGVLPDVPGIDDPRVLEVRAWLADGAPDLSGSVHVVWGADREGIAVADELLHRGRHVTIVGAQDVLAPDVGRRAKILVVPRLMSDPAVERVLGVQVLAVQDDAIIVSDGTRQWPVPAPGPVLVSAGAVPARALAGELLAALPGTPIVVVGDASGDGGTINAAITGAARAVESLLVTQS